MENSGALSSGSAVPLEASWRERVAALKGRVIDVEEVVEVASDDGSKPPGRGDVEPLPEDTVHLYFNDVDEIKQEQANLDGAAPAALRGLAGPDGAEDALTLGQRWAADAMSPSAALRAEFERKLVEAESLLARKRPALPWETGVMRRIFGPAEKERKLSPIWLEDPAEPLEDEASSLGMVHAPAGALLARRGSAEAPLGWLQAKDKRREAEVEKWLGLLLDNPQGSEVGRLLEQKRRGGMDRPGLGRLLSGFFSNRDPLTLSRHRVAMEHYMSWLEQSGRARLLPSTVGDAQVYLDSLWSEGVAGSRSIQYFKTCLFLGHVVGIEELRGLEKSSVVAGYVTQARRRVRHRLKRRPLTAAEVAKLEGIVCNEERDIQSRLVAGSLLCGLFARARWHELGAITRLELIGEGMGSFIEIETATVKIAAQHLRGRAAFCMTATGHGVHSFNTWSSAWLALRDKEGLRAESPGGVIESPCEDGTWKGVPMTVGRARSWMAYLLEVPNDTLIGTHSLKATLLAWANLAGLSDESRRAMGYHSGAAGKKSAMIELYGRDSQAAAARITSQLVAAVRRGLLDPDAQRGKQYPKGYSLLAAALSLGVPETAREDEASDTQSGGEGADSSSEGSAEDDATDEECAQDTELFAHRRLGTVHRVTEEDPRHFRCGRFNTSDVYAPVGLDTLADAVCCRICFR